MIPSPQASAPNIKHYLHELESKRQNILDGSGVLIFSFIALIIASMSAMAYIYYNLILDTLAPQISLNATFIANVFAEKLSYIAANGVPLQELRGLQEFSNQFIGHLDSLSHIVITDSNNTILHMVNLADKPLPEKAADWSAPIFAGQENSLVGQVQIYLSVGAFQKIIEDLKYEMVTLSIIALFLSADLLNSFYVMRIYDPLTEIFDHIKKLCEGKFARRLQFFQSGEVGVLCRRINDFINRCNERFSDFFYDAKETLDAQIDGIKSARIRRHVNSVTELYEFTGNRRVKPIIIQSAMSIKIPLLIFVMGQELSTAFLPVYFRQMDNITYLSTDFMVGLTFAGFICAPLISMYVSAHVLKFFCMRNYLIIGAVICMATLYGLAQIDNIMQAILLRTINGLGYGFIFLGSQIHIAGLSNDNNRARNSAVFARTMYAAVFFCPVIGGILAEQLGYRAIFIVSAVICGLSAVAMMVFLQGGGGKKLYPGDYDTQPHIASQPPPPQKQSVKARWQNNYSIGVLALFGSVPIKVNHFGVIMFIMPLLLADKGFRVVEIGHVLMLFGFLLLVCMPFIGGYLDKHKGAKKMLMWGSLLSLAAIGFLLFDHSRWIIAAVALFGLSQSMMTPALLTLVQNTRLQGDISQIQYQNTVGENLTLFRMIERLGLIVAIFLLSVFIGLGSYLYAFIFVLVVQILSIVVLQITPLKESGNYTITDEGELAPDKLAPDKLAPNKLVVEV